MGCKRNDDITEIKSSWGKCRVNKSSNKKRKFGTAEKKESKAK